MRSSAVPRLFRHVALLAFASLVLTACNDDDPVSPASAAGTYALVSIEETGFAECTITASGCTLNNTGSDVIVVEDGTLILSANGSFNLVVNGTTNGVDDALGTASGTWVRTQNGVTLTISGLPVSLAGTFNSAADALTFVIAANLFSPSASGNVTVTFDKQ